MKDAYFVALSTEPSHRIVYLQPKKKQNTKHDKNLIGAPAPTSFASQNKMASTDASVHMHQIASVYWLVDLSKELTEKSSIVGGNIFETYLAGELPELAITKIYTKKCSWYLVSTTIIIFLDQFSEFNRVYVALKLFADRSPGRLKHCIFGSSTRHFSNPGTQHTSVSA